MGIITYPVHKFTTGLVDLKTAGSQLKTIRRMLVCFYDSKGIVHKEFIPNGQNVTREYYLGILGRLWKRILRVRPEYRAQGSWILLHDNAPSHKSTAVRQFLT